MAGNTFTVAIVGAGASGALTATQLLKQSNSDGLDIRLIDPDQTTGRGLSYSTNDPEHRLNVPAAKMSAFADEPDHFLNWLHACGHQYAGTDFVPRALFGQYVEHCLNQAAQTSPASLTRIYEQCIDVTPRVAQGRAGFTVRLNAGTRFRADAVVMATGTPRTDRSWAPTELLEADRFIPDGWHTCAKQDEYLAGDHILLVGTGLTMVDLALALAKDPDKVIHAVSRRGLIPKAHRPAAGQMESPNVPEHISLIELRTLVADHLSKSTEQFGDWRPGFDSLRPITNELWQKLSLSDQQEFIDRDARRWDVLRHRMAPEAAAEIEQLQLSGRLIIHSAGVIGATELEHAINIRLTNGEQLNVQAVVDCTGAGPLIAEAGTGELLLANLLGTGTARAHQLGTGIDTDDAGQVLRRDGSANKNLLAIGPIRRGGLWETTAIPEIRVQAQELAADLLANAKLLPARSQTSHDLYGLKLTTNASAAGFYNEALARLLKVQSGVQESLELAIERDPEFGMAHLLMAVLGHEFDAPVDQQQHLQFALGSAQSATEREAAVIRTLAARINGTPGHQDLLQRYLREFPRDAVATSVAIPTIAFSGIYDVPEHAWSTVDYLAGAYGDDWWFNGLRAFTLQEQGRWEQAEKLATRSLAAEPEAGTSVHALSHVFYETGQHKTGLHWIDEWIDTCGRDAVHRAHFSWHAALHELALDDERAVLSRYHRQLAPPSVTGTRALVDSASLLWRCRVESVDVTIPSVRPVIEAAGEAARQPTTTFAAMHAAIAFAADSDSESLQQLSRYCSRGDVKMRQLAVPLINALSLYVAGQFDTCADQLAKLWPMAGRFGGSKAQMEVIQDTQIAALFHSGRGREAVDLLNERLDRRDHPRDRTRALEALLRNRTGPHQPHQ